MLNQKKMRCLKKGNSFAIKVTSDNSGNRRYNGYECQDAGRLNSSDNQYF